MSTVATLVIAEIESLEIFEALLNVAQDADAEVRTCAVWALGELGQAPHTVIQFLFETLNDENSEVRCAAVGALLNLWIDTDQIVSALHDVQDAKLESVN